VRLTTSPCKKKFVENLLEDDKAHLQGCGAIDDDDSCPPVNLLGFNNNVLGPNKQKLKSVQGKYIMRNFVICTFH
jgi:hypothetical protein